MSPTSRGRKSKPKKGRGSGRPGGKPRSAPARDQLPVVSAGAEALGDGKPRPPWFDASIQRVLDRAGGVMSARGPRELEEATAKLLGAELLRVSNAERAGLRFAWWFGELAEAAAAQVKGNAGAGGGAWQAAWRLLHGMTSIGPPELQPIVRVAIGHASAEAREAQQNDQARQQPPWLWKMPMIAATGDVWHLRDVYGSRLAIVAGMSYPGRADPSVFLFDIDACGLVDLAGGGVYDDVSQAVAAWRALVGEAAANVEPAAVETADDVRGLVYLDDASGPVDEGLTQARMDNWFRAPRRVHDVAAALEKRGMPVPPAESLFDVDPAGMASAFIDWHRERHGAAPAEAAATNLATEWLTGTLPGTEHAASPHRLAIRIEVIDDWRDEPGVAEAVKALLPVWAQWLGEKAGLPEPFIGRSVAVANGEPLLRSECGGARL